MSSSSEMSERTAREIYLAAFERPVRKAKPWTVMCAYNRINGVYAAENKEALTDILRGEWNFHGFVVSDWGAVNDRVADLESGMDLEMPSSFGMRDAEIVKAVRCGRLPEAVLDRRHPILRIVSGIWTDGILMQYSTAMQTTNWHEIASQCMVLLKNEDHILPLSKTETAAFIGKLRKAPVFRAAAVLISLPQGESALKWRRTPSSTPRAETSDIGTGDLMAEAVAAAKAAKVAVVFAGLPDL
ncbi:MAG: glycoside hydrolase family 3 N-terminal domain-containing protein [Ruminococcus callidus]